jgi:hypothetical protein
VLPGNRPAVGHCLQECLSAGGVLGVFQPVQGSPCFAKFLFRIWYLCWNLTHNARVFQTGGWPMNQRGIISLSTVEVTETEDANGFPILDQGRAVRISPRFEMLSTCGPTRTIRTKSSHRVSKVLVDIIEHGCSLIPLVSDLRRVGGSGSGIPLLLAETPFGALAKPIC